MKATSALLFVAANHEKARQEDQVILVKTLQQLLDNDTNILDVLEVQREQILEALQDISNVGSHAQNS